VKLHTRAEDFYLSALGHLLRSGVPFMLGGAYALREYGGISRDTKDIDVFCKPGDCPRLLETLNEAGYHAEVTYSNWLAKAFHGDHFIDVIFGSRNDRCAIDDRWFQYARPVHAFGFPLLLIPPEEMIWSKAYVQDRFRFDGADIAHILRKQGAQLDWHRLLERFDEDWEVLLAHLINFRFTYPSDRTVAPDWLLRELCARVEEQLADPVAPERVCRGPLLTPNDYQVDILAWGYRDARSEQ
jgi:hypothetical protein